MKRTHKLLTLVAILIVALTVLAALVSQGKQPQASGLGIGLSEGNAWLYIREGVAYDGSVDISNGASYLSLYRVIDDNTTRIVDRDIQSGLVMSFAEMNQLFPSYNKKGYAGSLLTKVKPGEEYRLVFDGQRYCPEMNFTIPNDFVKPKGKKAKIVIAPKSLQQMTGDQHDEGTIFIDIDYMECAHFPADKQARSYTGVLTEGMYYPNSTIVWPLALTIDDEAYAGGGGKFYLANSQSFPLSMPKNDADRAIAERLRAMYMNHPDPGGNRAYSIGYGPREPYYVTLKGKLGPEVIVGGDPTKPKVTMRRLSVESIEAEGIDYYETHTGYIGVPQVNAWADFSLVRHMCSGYPGQPWHGVGAGVEKANRNASNAAEVKVIQDTLQAIVGPIQDNANGAYGYKNLVTLKAKRSNLGMRYLIVKDVEKILAPALTEDEITCNGIFSQAHQ